MQEPGAGEGKVTFAHQRPEEAAKWQGEQPGCDSPPPTQPIHRSINVGYASSTRYLSIGFVPNRPHSLRTWDAAEREESACEKGEREAVSVRGSSRGLRVGCLYTVRRRGWAEREEREEAL